MKNPFNDILFWGICFLIIYMLLNLVRITFIYVGTIGCSIVSIISIICVVLLIDKIVKKIDENE